MTQKEINELKDRMYRATSDYPIGSVLDRYYAGNQQRSGSTLFISCPNGCDHGKRLTKCAVSTGRNFYKCFACDEGGGPVKLRSVLTGESFSDAMVELAYDMGEITTEEYEALKEPYVRKKLKKDDRSYRETSQRECDSNVPLDPNAINIVYSEMLKLDAFALTDEARAYLRARGVSDFSDFFCYHETFSIDKLTERIQKDYPRFTKDNFFGIPGFYFQYSDESKTKGRWLFRAPVEHSVGIIIRNAERKVVGLQMRNIQKEGSRYYWLSSTSMNESDNCAFGSSPGAPTHVEYPEGIKTGSVSFIEGFFKGKRLVEKTNGLTLAFQGVNNYSATLSELENALKSDELKRRVEGRHKLMFCIFCDADFVKNWKVCKAEKAFAEELAKKYRKSIYFYFWKEEEGKGFDDLLDNHPDDWKKFISVLPEEKFFARYQAASEKAQGDLGITSLKSAGKDYEDLVYRYFWNK